MRIARDSDPDAMPDFAGFVTTASEPWRAFSAQIEPIKPTINPQCRCEPSWSPRQVAQPLDLTISLHDRDTSRGSTALMRTPAPIPAISLERRVEVGAKIEAVTDATKVDNLGTY